MHFNAELGTGKHHVTLRSPLQSLGVTDLADNSLCVHLPGYPVVLSLCQPITLLVEYH